LREGRLTGGILLGDCNAAPRLLRTFHKAEMLRDNPVELVFPADVTGTVIAVDTATEGSIQPLKEVIAIIRPERWIQTKQKVESIGITAFTHHRVVGRGRQRGLHFLARRGAHSGTGFRFLPKRMVSWIVAESQVDALVQAIMETNRTGQIGDGKIFVLPLDEVKQIQKDERTMEKSQPAENVLTNA
jgi:nitrogen regulatory protein PII 2